MTKIVLGIETSCDETAVGAVSLEGRLLANVVVSQAPLHAKHGGVVPELASRQHVQKVSKVAAAAVNDAGINWSQVAAVAVTCGPGLAGSLVVGLNFAKGLAVALGGRLIGVNHLEGHITAAWLEYATQLEEALDQGPILGIVVSGGHTDMYITERDTKGALGFTLLGETRDDAAGEAFDKVARILGLGYPGGPEIETRAAQANGKIQALPRAQLPDSYDFSFSGLKTAVLRRVEAIGLSTEELAPEFVNQMARATQESIVDSIVSKATFASEESGCVAIVVGGGVAASNALRKEFARRSNVPLFIPSRSLCTDNGAMIAMRGLMLYQQNVTSDLGVDIVPSWRGGQMSVANKND